MRLEVVEPALDEAGHAIKHGRAINVALGAVFAFEFNRSLERITSQPRAWARTGAQRQKLDQGGGAG